MNKKIKVYSISNCPYCFTLKEYLKSINIVFEDIDVSKNKMAFYEMIDKSKQTGVPVIDIDGEIVIGFDKEKINQIIKN
jgi:glutaredoxin-like YruB-family protein